MTEAGMGKRGWGTGGLVGGGLAFAMPAVAQKSADTLRITWLDAVPDVDFYHNSLRSGFILQIHAWDTLVYRDPDTFQIRPLLATAWNRVDDPTIAFTLRQGG